MDELRFVKFYASVKHANQFYSCGLPYTHHLQAVENVLRKFHFDTPFMLQAAWLHDVVEDTDTKITEIAEMFGQQVADLVSCVTNEPGQNRKVRNALTYPKIRNGGCYAVALKLADRIANIEAGGQLVEMYKNEYEDFKRALKTEGELVYMWDYLDWLLSR